MPLKDITVNKQQGGLGRPLPGKDHYSGLLFFSSTLPSGFNSSNRIKKGFSLKDFEDLGIVGDFSDETKATGTYTFTNVGAAGDSVEITYNLPSGKVVSLGKYIRKSTDTTVTILATSYKNFVNLYTYSHGFSASNSAGVLTYTVKKGLGVGANSGSPVTATIVGTIAGTLVQPSGGVASKFAPMNYHISEYFRMQPKGVLWVGIYDVPGSYDFAEATSLINFAEGEMRLLGVHVISTTLTTGMVQALEAVANTAELEHKNCSIILGADITGIALSALSDLATLDSEHVSVTIGQDGAAKGFELWKATGVSITDLGTVLGTVAFADVAEDIGHIGRFNISNGVEHDVAAFANGVLNKDQSTSLMDNLDTYRYIFHRKFIDKAGTYFNDSHTATSFSSDYAYIENNRSIDKAIRLLRAALLPDVKGKLFLNEDGSLQDVTVAHFESTGDAALDQMLRDGELSQRKTIVDPVQDVLSTSKLIVQEKLIPVAIGREIVINIGFVKSLS